MSDARSNLQSLVEDHDVNTLRSAHEEARKTLDHQINTINEVDDKASEILRYCLLFIGVIVTAASIVAANPL